MASAIEASAPAGYRGRIGGDAALVVDLGGVGSVNFDVVHLPSSETGYSDSGAGLVEALDKRPQPPT